MKLNKFKIFLLLVVSVVGISSIISYNSQKYSSSVNINDSKVKDNNMLGMMLETSAGSGEYKETTATSWPTDGYEFNENLSKCERGSKLSWDSTKKTVVMMGNVSDKCYVYFDVYVPPTINEVCSNGDTMSNCIKKLYTKQGENNLYLHDSNLTNGAGDNSYRYAGSSETTNNFVCFGYDSTDESCPTDYLYRIIGVFENQVKLIKYDYAKATLLGTDGDYSNTYSGAGWSSSSYGKNNGSNAKTEIGVYYWNYLNGSSSTNTWSESRLNTTNLNKNYLNNIGTNWFNRIATHTWKVGGNTYANIVIVTAPNAYINEITSPAEETTYDAKIGLMYASDYGFAVEPSAWTTALYNYDRISITNKNWMYMGLYEWTIFRRSDSSSAAFRVNFDGNVDNYGYIYYYYAVRPVLYLKSTISYAGGSGTAAKPILVK